MHDYVYILKSILTKKHKKIVFSYVRGGLVGVGCIKKRKGVNFFYHAWGTTKTHEF